MSLVVEGSSDQGRVLVATSAWTQEAEDVVRSGRVTGLVLNSARGFVSGERGLGFLSEDWVHIESLAILDRSLIDLEPLSRLSRTVTRLSIQAAQTAHLEAAWLPVLEHLDGEWYLVGQTARDAASLKSLTTWRFSDVDMRVFMSQFGLESLTVKDCKNLESLSGLEGLVRLKELKIIGGRRLSDISSLSARRNSLRTLILEECPNITSIAPIAQLIGLRVLSIADCGKVASLKPLAALRDLQHFEAWGSTQVLDGDLTPLEGLTSLDELRMMDRKYYKPRVAELGASVF